MLSCSTPFISRSRSTNETRPEPILTLPTEATNETVPAPTQTANPPAATLPPTSTPTTSPTSQAQQPPPNATPLTFKNGGTSAFDQRPIAQGGQQSYLVNASAGQTLIAGAASPDHDVYLAIQSVQTGQQFLSASEKQTDWSAVLPQSGDYLITLSSPNPDTNYFLSVEIPANIVFPPGHTETSVEGHIAVHTDLHPGLMTRVRYLVQGTAGQTMSIAVNSPAIDNLSMAVYGQSDGQPYKRFEVRGVSGTFELPLTQGYYIDVVSTGGVSTDFTLQISIK